MDITSLLSDAGVMLLGLAVSALGLVAERHLGASRRTTRALTDHALLDAVMRRAVAFATAQLDRNGDGAVTIGDKNSAAGQAAGYVIKNNPDLVQRIGAQAHQLRERALAELEQAIVGDARRRKRRRKRREGPRTAAEQIEAYGQVFAPGGGGPSSGIVHPDGSVEMK